MRLINVYTLDMEEYFDSNVPDYAILSHTWGQEELSLREWTMVTQSRKLDPGWLPESVGTLSHFLGISSLQEIEKKSGYSKIIACCEQAKRDNLHYAWADTCCIDKTSSAELSEAINSMFEWYKSSNVCYAYFSDVHTETAHSQGQMHLAIRNSRWFTRGWTLQEFLAPRRLAFFDSEWNFISFKADLVDLLGSVTGISSGYIDGTEDIRNASVAQRMSWASKRQTTRKEDIAYSLIGIFDVNMPLLYGEGDKAFLRLHEEIVRQSEDHSYLAWGFQMPLVRDFHGLFARSPAEFAGCADVLHEPRACEEGVTQMTNKGLQIRLLIYYQRNRMDHSHAILRCCGPKGMKLALPVGYGQLEGGAGVWRLPSGTPVALGERWGCPSDWTQKSFTVFMKRTPPGTFWDEQVPLGVEVLGILREEDPPIQLFEVVPPHTWMPSRGGFPISVASKSNPGRVLMKLAPSHAPCSKTDHVIVAIDFKGTKIEGEENQSQLARPSRIRPRVIRGDEIQMGKIGYLSLAETIFGEHGHGLLYESLTEFGSEAEVCGYIVSVEVEGNPWAINIKLAGEGKVEK